MNCATFFYIRDLFKLLYIVPMFYTLVWPQIINWDLLILRLNKQYWRFIEMCTKQAFGFLWYRRLTLLVTKCGIYVYHFWHKLYFFNKIKCWKIIVWYLLWRDITMLSKIMKFGLSKLIFYVQNYSKPSIFFIEEYKIRSTTYIMDTFCLLSFLKHYFYYNWTQIPNLNSKSGVDLPKTF